MSRQNQRFQSPFGAGRKQPEGLNQQTFLSGAGVHAALNGLGYGTNGRTLPNGANGIPYLQPSIFASPKAPAGARTNSDPPTPTANPNNSLPAGRPSAQTPGRSAPLGSGAKLGMPGYTVTTTTPSRKNSGSLNNTASGGVIAGIGRLVDATIRSSPNVSTSGTTAAAAPGTSLSVIGSGTMRNSTSGGPSGAAAAGLSATVPLSRPGSGTTHHNHHGGLLATMPAGGRPGGGAGGGAAPVPPAGHRGGGGTHPTVPGLTFSVGSNQSMGSRGYQEDYRSIADSSTTPGLSHLPNVMLGAAVYDGHGGKQVSHWLSSSYCLLNRAMEAVQQLITGGGSPNDVASVLDDVFTACGNAAAAGRMTAGSCVAMALLVQSGGVPWVLSANVGDSRTILVSWDDMDGPGMAGGGPSSALGGRTEATQLSVDHKLGPAKTSEETRRVQAAGGTVIQLFGTWRIDGSLAVARAIGDSDFARYVSCRPTVQCRQLQRRDRWLIIASDGLWDVMTNEEVAMFCRAQHQLSATKLSEALVREAVRNRGSGDNTTVIAVRLQYSGAP
ncbi:hypothetical protein Agub_g11848 [Astrephomene gubernaculifera]|uniref:PPM-type phosphatase domain-containing protein n=1 Tax=Astrephomene gubernaculifera TaxID=47775 RepID=A0AAD3HQS5_9CHLO|nr:hypothetical protein Agub_g11848 [Astrephomene gubernaculifera]